MSNMEGSSPRDRSYVRVVEGRGIATQQLVMEDISMDVKQKSEKYTKMLESLGDDS